MNNGNWDFSELPVDDQKLMVDYYNSQDWLGIIQLHDAYRLSSFEYSCCNPSEVREHVREAIELGKLKY